MKRRLLVVMVVFLAACGGGDGVADGGDSSGPGDGSADALSPSDVPGGDTPARGDVPGGADVSTGLDAPSGTDAPTGIDVRVSDVPVADVPAARDVPVPPDAPVIVPDGGSPDDPNTRTRTTMCTRWLAERTPRATSTWTMGATACDPGTLNPAAHDDALRILNLYRWLSGIAAVGAAPALAARQQACAIMMHANNMLSHTPPASWMCYSAAGATAAGSSNLALGGGGYPASSVPQYINERGSLLGHRRWCLYPSLGPTWFGATSRASCMQVFQRATGTLPPVPFVAYPNPGLAPIENTTGHWSVQPGMRAVAGGTVTVVDTSTGMPMPTTPFDASNSYGGGVAVAWTPTGWTPLADRTYRVTITYATSPMIQYNVTPTRCP